MSKVQISCYMPKPISQPWEYFNFVCILYATTVKVNMKSSQTLNVVCAEVLQSTKFI